MANSDCAHYKQFQTFLNVLTKSMENDDTQKEKAIVTRVSNDSYAVSEGDELQAEIYTIIWNHLQAKRCPPHFDIALLRAAVDAVRKCLKDGSVPHECQAVAQIKNVSGDETTNKATETQYDLLKLQKFVVNMLEQLITRLASDNAKTENLKSFYAQVKTPCSVGKCCCNTQASALVRCHPAIWSYASHIKNKPRKMEDRHFCLDRYSEVYQVNTTPYSLYGVFDGHSGTLAATYATCQLPYLLAERLKRINNPSDCSESTFCEAVESVFLQADRQFCQKRISSGTTAVIALVMHCEPARLFVAWVGDSKALLVSPTVSLQLVKSHKPDAPDERKRIGEAGSSVFLIQGNWRVDGILNVARSIGDHSVHAVIAEPDFVDVTLHGHDFLILGTDGLWDHASEGSIVQTVYEALMDAEQKIEDIPKLLIDLAKKGDSQDNITVVLVLLKERHAIVDNFKKS